MEELSPWNDSTEEEVKPRNSQHYYVRQKPPQEVQTGRIRTKLKRQVTPNNLRTSTINVVGLPPLCVNRSIHTKENARLSCNPAKISTKVLRYKSPGRGRNRDQSDPIFRPIGKIEDAIVHRKRKFNSVVYTEGLYHPSKTVIDSVDDLAKEVRRRMA